LISVDRSPHELDLVFVLQVASDGVHDRWMIVSDDYAEACGHARILTTREPVRLSA
jgi:hypothetical protein